MIHIKLAEQIIMKNHTPRRSSKFKNHNGFFNPWIVGGLLVASLSSAAMWGGYQLGVEAGAAGQILQLQVEKQRKELDEARFQARAQLDAIALRLGDMQAELLRMEALGEKLVSVGELDPDEFNFTELPPRGGLDASGEAISVELPELLMEVESVAHSISDRTHKLELMQGLMLNGKIQQELEPEGMPVEKGWISSGYGYRKDPFNGKKSFHDGVDIASSYGAPVVAVASGVVMEAIKKSGYGYYVEINHADGLVSKYAHNSKVFVGPGDLVEKGDVIALVGSSGRSTGPHVHFEITQDGKSIDPSKFIE